MECSIASLKNRRHAHLLLLMYKLKEKERMLKKLLDRLVCIWLLFFWHYKPNNEKARKNVIYRGAIEWNSLLADTRNMELKDFKNMQKRELLQTIQP